MQRSRWLLTPGSPREPVTRVRRGAPVRLSTHAASAGLVAVLLVLTAFSVTAAVTNARASA